MNKLCCCADPELPDITVSFNCACCESRVERRTDTTDLEMPVPETCKEEKEMAKEDEVTTCCCCFRRKRHAKSKEVGKERQDGGKT